MVVILALFIAGLVFSTLGAGIQLGTDVTISFASVELGRELLSRRDDFIAALTPLDRRARMQTNQDVSEKDFLAFVGRSVQSWTPEETNRITAALQTLEDKLARWHLIPADRNWYRDYVVAHTVVRAIENLGLKWPKPKEDLSRIRIV